MNTNKTIFLSQHILAMRIADIFNENRKIFLISLKTNISFFPTPATIYEKEIVKDEEKRKEFEKEENKNSQIMKFNSTNTFNSKALKISNNISS